MARPEDKTIVVVEDEPDVRLFLQTVLEDAGFNVARASDGEEALRIIREKKPDFISLDLVLPRKTGHKLLPELKRDKALSRIPVLIVTCEKRTATIPTGTRRPKGSLHWAAITSPPALSTRNTPHVASAPSRPQRHAITAKIMSLWSSGRRL